MPLSFDLPLTQLKTYNGRSPKPADFDAFWEKSLKEMRSINPKIEIIPSKFQTPFAECSDLYFTGVENARIHAKLLRPRNPKGRHPAVLQFHGYSGSSGDWIDKLGFAANGCTLASLDCRGQGGLSEDTGGTTGGTLRGHIIRGLHDAPEKLLFRHIFLDTAQLAKIVMEMPDVDPDRVGVEGGSQGGALTVACAALEPRIKRAAPVFPFLCDYKRVWEMDQAKDAYWELQDYFKKFDPLHEKETEVFEKLGYIDIQNLCPRIKAEIFWGIGLMDTICPPSTQFAAYNKITSKKEMIVYPDFGHETLPGFRDKAYSFLAGL